MDKLNKITNEYQNIIDENNTANGILEGERLFYNHATSTERHNIKNKWIYNKEKKIFINNHFSDAYYLKCSLTDYSLRYFQQNNMTNKDYISIIRKSANEILKELNYTHLDLEETCFYLMCLNLFNPYLGLSFESAILEWINKEGCLQACQNKGWDSNYSLDILVGLKDEYNYFCSKTPNQTISLQLKGKSFKKMDNKVENGKGKEYYYNKNNIASDNDLTKEVIYIYHENMKVTPDKFCYSLTKDKWLHLSFVLEYIKNSLMK